MGINLTLKCLKAPPQPIMGSLVKAQSMAYFHIYTYLYDTFPQILQLAMIVLV